MPNNQQEFIPVYLFLGFLEAGKTKFMQDALEDAHFANGERTLLLVCEEGVEEYDTSKFKEYDITMQIIEDVSELTPENLERMAKECRAEREQLVREIIDRTENIW